jgi:hypothetical protein
MFFVIMMSQHIGDNSFNVVRLAVSIGCQRFILFLCYTRCYIALPEKRIALRAYCAQYFVVAAAYFAFGIAVAQLAPTSPNENAPAWGVLSYIGIIPAFEILCNFGYFSPCLVNFRMAIDIPHAINRMGEMMLISVGEISVYLSRWAPFHL